MNKIIVIGQLGRDPEMGSMQKRRYDSQRWNRW